MAKKEVVATIAAIITIVAFALAAYGHLQASHASKAEVEELRTEFERHGPHAGVVNGSSSAVLLAGRVTPSGTSTSNEFVSELAGEGQYSITFTRQFAATPAFVATATSAGRSDTIIIVEANAEGATVWTSGIDDRGRAMPNNTEFSFVAIGESE